MEQLQIQQSSFPQMFKSEQFGQVCGVEIGGEPWFIGKDIAAALGYKNTKDAILTKVDEEDRRILQRSEITTFENHIPKSVFPVEFVPANIPPRGVTIISESGVYALIFGSKLPEAKQFKHWITHDVIPAIRKHEMYITPQMAEKILADPDIMIRILQELKAERNKNAALEEENSLLAKEVLAHNPRELVTRIIRKVGGVGMRNNFKYAWNLWKKDMYSLKGISLNRRVHDGSMLDAVREDEWQDAISVAVALARDFGVDISDEMRRTDWVPGETA